MNATAVMPLGVNDLKLAEQVRNQYQVTVDAAVSVDDLTDPQYWVHVAARLRVGDKIEVLSADASWYAELRVMEVGRTASFGARASLTLGPVSLTNRHELPALNDYDVRPFGSSWQVFKAGSDTPVKTDLPDKIAADKWVVQQRRALAA